MWNLHTCYDRQFKWGGGGQRSGLISSEPGLTKRYIAFHPKPRALTLRPIIGALHST